MVLLTSLVVAVVLWVLLWGLGAGGFDAFMLSLTIMVLAAAVHIVLPYLPGRRAHDEPQSDPAPYT